MVGSCTKMLTRWLATLTIFVIKSNVGTFFDLGVIFKDNAFFFNQFGIIIGVTKFVGAILKMFSACIWGSVLPTCNSKTMIILYV